MEKTYLKNIEKYVEKNFECLNIVLQAYVKNKRKFTPQEIEIHTKRLEELTQIVEILGYIKIKTNRGNE